MRYHYKQPIHDKGVYGSVYYCNHVVYSVCTLFLINKKGLAVIQQNYDKETKHTYWSNVDKILVDDLYLNPNFKQYFDKKASICKNGFYPTVTLRQIMWALRMKPLQKQPWETVFDRANI